MYVNLVWKKSSDGTFCRAEKADEWSCILSEFMLCGHDTQLLHHNRQDQSLTCWNVFSVVDGCLQIWCKHHTRASNGLRSNFISHTLPLQRKQYQHATVLVLAFILNLRHAGTDLRPFSFLWFHKRKVGRVSGLLLFNMSLPVGLLKYNFWTLCIYLFFFSFFELIGPFTLYFNFHFYHTSCLTNTVAIKVLYFSPITQQSQYKYVDINSLNKHLGSKQYWFYSLQDCLAPSLSLLCPAAWKTHLTFQLFECCSVTDCSVRMFRWKH